MALHGCPESTETDTEEPGSDPRVLAKKKKKKRALIYSYSLCSKFPSENKERYIWSLGFVQNIKAFSFLQSLCCRTKERMLCEQLVGAYSLKKNSAKTWLPWNIGPRDLICSAQVRGSDLIRRGFFYSFWDINLALKCPLAGKLQQDMKCLGLWEEGQLRGQLWCLKGSCWHLWWRQSMLCGTGPPSKSAVLQGLLAGRANA